MNKSEAIEIIREFIENRMESEKWYQDIKTYLKAIILYGSVAKGINRLDSDIDVMFILPLEMEEKYMKGEYFFEYKNNEINIVIRSIERLRKIAEGKYDPFQAEVFRESEIIWQKDDEVCALLKLLNNKNTFNHPN